MKQRAIRVFAGMALLALGMWTPFGGGGVAHAAEARITSPGAGSAHGPGFQGPVVINLDGAPSGVYDVEVYDADYDFSRTWSRSYTGGAGGVWSITLPALNRSGRYYIELYDDSYDLVDSRSFTVRPYSATITSPAEGVTKLAGSTLKASVRWANATPTSTVSTTIYNLSRGRVNQQCRWTGPAAGVTTTCTSDPLAAGRYEVRAAITPQGGSSRVLTRRAFRVEPRLNVYDVGLRPKTFYPRVRDGFRDHTRLTWRMTAPATNTVQVINSRGRVVRSADLGEQRAGWHEWRWNGRDRSGSKVPTGTYRLRLATSGAQGQSERTVRSVTVATGIRTEHVTRHRDGWDDSSAHASSDCYLDYGFWDDDGLFLDCWGGDHARAKYGFTIRADAFNIDWDISGTQHCCTTGRISRIGERVSSRRYRVTVTVSEWRSLDIHWVRVSYSYRHAI